jgi:gamma-glutamyltranspeptidase/glutathione hydrolase
MSAMSPTIVFAPDGKFAIATGSPGGPAIIDFVAQSLIDMLDGGMGAQAAASAPHSLNLNGRTVLERGTALDALTPQLTAMGHAVVEADLESGLHIVKRVAGGYVGGADPRRDGVALGD